MQFTKSCKGFILILPTDQLSVYMKKIFLFTSLFLFIATTNAQLKTRNYIDDNAAVPREHPLDFKKLKLELSFETSKGLVKGKVTHYFSPLLPKVESFFLDAIQMEIKQISLNGKDVRYHADSAGITIFANEPLAWNTDDSLTIVYEATPRRGLYFIGWNDKYNLSRKQIWSQGEGIDNRNWIPMYDERNDKLISELMVTFDKDYKVLSNGHLVDLKTNTDGTNTWHYLINHPHAPYLIMLGVGKYDIKETHSASGVPMHLYSYPEWKNRVEPTYQYSEAMVDFFEKEIGVNYPWESYSQIPVQDYMFGAMENTTATIFGDFYLVDSRGVLDRNYVAVNAHELAHQWFGDDVTALSDAHQWLQESFATYYNQLFEREVFGDDYFHWSLRGSQNAAIDESTRNKFAVAHSEGGGVRIYGKGAFVLNMLKYVVGGREVYNKAIKHYLEKHAYQNVDTHDLLIAFEETTGMQLDWFWDEWLHRGGEPAYNINYSELANNGTFIIQQTQALTDVTGYRNGLYKMPIWIDVYYADGTSDKKQYWIQEQTEIIHFTIPENKKVDYVLFDAGNEVMKSISFKKPFSFLQSQALKATNVLDRYDAVTAMKSISLETKRDVLIKAFYNEKFFAVRTEVIAQLANDTNEKSIQLLKDALTDKDAAVRKSVLKNVNPITSNLLPEFEKLLTDSSYEIVENALQKLYDVNLNGVSKYLAETKNIEGNLGKNVLIKWLEISYYTTKINNAGQLVKFTSNSYEFRTRGNAIAALKRMNYFTEELLANLIDALFSSNGRLSGPANDLIKFFYGQYKYKKTISNYIASQQWATWQKAMLAANGY